MRPGKRFLTWRAAYDAARWGSGVYGRRGRVYRVEVPAGHLWVTSW